MPQRRNQQRKPQNQQRNQVARREPRLITFSRQLTFYTEFDYTGWTDLYDHHLRSLNKTLKFRVSDLPGWTSISQNWDQYKIRKAHFHFVNDSKLSGTGIDNVGQVMTLLSSYDPDGGTTNANDILSRNNLSITTMGYGSNYTCTLSCVPGYVTSDGEIRRDIWIDQGTSTLDFFAFQTVVDILKQGISPGDMLALGCYVSVDLEFKGAR